MSSMKGRRKRCIPSGDSRTLNMSRSSSWGRRATSRASELLLERKLGRGGGERCEREYLDMSDATGEKETHLCGLTNPAFWSYGSVDLPSIFKLRDFQAQGRRLMPHLQTAIVSSLNMASSSALKAVTLPCTASSSGRRKELQSTHRHRGCGSGKEGRRPHTSCSSKSRKELCSTRRHGGSCRGKEGKSAPHIMFVKGQEGAVQHTQARREVGPVQHDCWTEGRSCAAHAGAEVAAGEPWAGEARASSPPLTCVPPSDGPSGSSSA